MKRILIIEDDLATIKLLKYYCQYAGYEVLEAHNGEEALKCISIENIDLILLDLMLPDTDGINITKVIRNNNKTCSIPIIVISVISNFDQRNLVLEAGANDYLVKPPDKSILLEKINELINLNS